MVDGGQFGRRLEYDVNDEESGDGGEAADEPCDHGTLFRT